MRIHGTRSKQSSATKLIYHLHLKEESCSSSNQASQCASGTKCHRGASSEGGDGRNAGRRGRGAIGAVSGRGRDELEVGAGQTGGVAAMNDYGLIPEEVGRAWGRREIVIGPADLPCRCSDVAMLASQIASLARLWDFGLAGVEFSTLGRVKMGRSSRAVAVGRNSKLVNMIDFGVCKR